MSVLIEGDEVTSTGRRRTLPNFIALVAGVICLWNLIQMYAGALATGNSWDERTHGLMLQSWLDTGRYWLDGFDNVKYIYGPVGDLVGQLATMVTGSGGRCCVGFTASAYESRHVATATLALVGVGATFAIGRVITKSWRWGLLAATILTCIPMWTGHGMFNMKDMASAVGYTLVTLGLVILAAGVPVSPRGSLPFAALVIYSGTVLAAGTRTALWIPLLGTTAALAFALGYRGLSDRVSTQSKREALVCSATALISCVTGLATLALVYPKLWAPPFLGPRGSLGQSAEFQNVLYHGCLGIAPRLHHGYSVECQ